jgi:hypothetical protein
VRDLALLWFLSGLFVAPVLVAGGVAGAVWLTATRQWSTRTRARSATLLALVEAAVLAPGVAVWNSSYAQ